MCDHQKRRIYQSLGTCQGQGSHCTFPTGNTVCHVIWHTHPAEKWHGAYTIF